MLDANLSEKELQQAVYDLKDEKAPGLNDLPPNSTKKFGL